MLVSGVVSAKWFQQSGSVLYIYVYVYMYMCVYICVYKCIGSLF